MADDKTPELVQMPKATAEITYAPGKGVGVPDKTIKGGTVITDALAKEAKLDADTLAALEESGHVVYVDVYKG